MFSAAQEQYLKSLIPEMVDEGYSYYVAYTYSAYGSGWNYQQQPDLYVVFSKQSIIANSGYLYDIPAGSVRFVIRTGNYSTSNGAVNSARVVTESFSGRLAIESYEHIYTNAVFSGVSLQPDFGWESGVYENRVSLASVLAVFILLLFILFRSIKLPAIR